MRELTKCLKALANERRLKIISILAKHEPLIINDIADRLGLSLKSTSKHIQKLSDCGIVERNQRSSQVYCRLSRKHPVFRSLAQHIR